LLRGLMVSVMASSRFVGSSMNHNQKQNVTSSYQPLT
jgi:hypothetical protein